VLKSKHYASYVLFSYLGQDQFANKFHGSTQGGIAQNNLKSMKIPLPTIDDVIDKNQQKNLVLFFDTIFEKKK